MALTDKKYKYFLYSDEQFKEKNEILGKVGKTFSPGVVVVNGKRRNFTQVSNGSSIPRFIDTIIVTEGYIEDMTYTMPKIERRKGN